MYSLKSTKEPWEKYDELKELEYLVGKLGDFKHIGRIERN